MALTFTELHKEPVGSRYRVTGLMSITSGGGTLTAADVQLDSIVDFHARPQGGYVFDWIKSTGVIAAKYGDYDAVADGVLITDASASQSNIPFEAWGY